MSEAHETESSHPKSTNSAKRFYSNPVFGFISCIVSIIGLGLFLFVDRRTSPDLVYHVDPARATIVHANQSSRIHIEIDGKAVKENITAAQVIIWNDGGESIRGKNLLTPFVIKTGPLNPIIEADIQKVTRKVVGLQLDKSKISEGQLDVDWTILEQDDGAVIQLIYYGDDQTPITASATVEQQGAVRVRGNRGWVLLLGLLLAIPATLIGFLVNFSYMEYMNLWLRERTLKGRVFFFKRSYQVLFGLHFVLIVVMCVAIIYSIAWITSNPPFDVTGYG